jgi:ComF family protein
MASFVTFVRHLGTSALDLLYPPSCVNCQRAGTWLCSNCRADLPYLIEPVCLRCSLPLSNPEQVCRWCETHPWQALDTLQSVALFEGGALRPAIHKLKFNNLRVISQDLAQLIVERIAHKLPAVDIVVPVPLHPARLRQRGYNQSELIASYLARALELAFDPESLRRTRATRSQVGLDVAARRQNVAQAFTCTSNSLADKAVLLFDDVCTSGATLDACALALRQARVGVVHGLTLARAR